MLTVSPDDLLSLINGLKRRVEILENTNPLQNSSITDLLNRLGIWKNFGISSGSGTFSSSTFAGTGGSVNFSLAAPANVLALFLGNGQMATEGAGKWGNLRANLVGVAQSGAINFGNVATSTGMGWQYVAALAAGSYTWNLEAASNDNATVFTLAVGVIQAFQITPL